MRSEQSPSLARRSGYFSRNFGSASRYSATALALAVAPGFAPDEMDHRGTVADVVVELSDGENLALLAEVFLGFHLAIGGGEVLLGARNESRETCVGLLELVRDARDEDAVARGRVVTALMSAPKQSFRLFLRPMRPGFRDIIRRMQPRTSRTQGVVLNTEDLNLSETAAHRLWPCRRRGNDCDHEEQIGSCIGRIADPGGAIRMEAAFSRAKPFPIKPLRMPIRPGSLIDPSFIAELSPPNPPGNSASQS